MTVGAILTLGFGSFGGVNLLPTLGYLPATTPARTHRGGIDERRREKLAQIQRDDEDLLTLAAMVVSRIPWD